MTTGQKGLPAGWKWVKLQDVAFYQEGPGLRKWQWTQHGMKVVNVTNILKDGSINIDNTDKFISLDEFEATYKHFAVEEGDILLVSSGSSYGKVSRIEAHHLPLMMNTSVIRLHSLNTLVLNDIYLLSYLKTVQFKRELDELVTGAAQKNFGPSHLSKISIPLPPLEEQKRIAGILNKAEGIKKLREEADKKTEELIPAIFHEMFGDTSKFDVARLDEICNIKMGNSPRGDTYNTKGIGTPLLNGPTEFGDRNPTPIQWTTEPTRLCENGDILLCVRGNTTGRMNWADQTYCIGRGLAAISPASGAVTNEYLFEALQSKMSVLLGQLSSGSVFPNISKNYLSEFTMPIPPSNIQEQFSSTISDLKEMKALQTITRYDIEELQSSLLKRAFRGEL